MTDAATLVEEEVVMHGFGCHGCNETRADIAPCIGYLQRVAHEPVIDHVKKASHILRYVRRVKRGLHYRRLLPPLKMVAVADSAYKS